MSFWSKLRRIVLACCIALLAATAVALLVAERANDAVAPNYPSHRFIEN